MIPKVDLLYYQYEKDDFIYNLIEKIKYYFYSIKQAKKNETDCVQQIPFTAVNLSEYIPKFLTRALEALATLNHYCKEPNRQYILKLLIDLYLETDGYISI